MAAPLAPSDDDWHDFNGFRAVAARHKPPPPPPHRAHAGAEGVAELLESFPESESGISGEAFAFASMEDMVNGFDEKLNQCFRNDRTKDEAIVPVKPISEETTLKKDELWNALTDNYGNVMPVDWSQSRARSLHLPTLNVEERLRVSDVNLDVSDDEELREQMDMHSIIVPCVNEEPVLTAEQVIEEIEEMMQDSPDTDPEQNPARSDLIQKSSSTDHNYEERVRSLSIAEINELLEEEENAIRRYSEELVQHLALRDELDFEKEVKNSFISVLIDVQNRQKEHRELLKKKKRLKNAAGAQHGRAERLSTSRFSMESISTAIQKGFRQTFRSEGGVKQCLTTVIPYDKKGGPPSVEDLQILTKILQAMRDDSDKVPSLLTDYILKVLCPT